MAYGKWGGRAWPINYAISATFWMAVRARLAIQSWLNKRRFVGALTTEQGNRSTAKLTQYLSAGFRKINIGGGNINLDGFINIDYSPSSTAERLVVADIRHLEFIPDSSIDHIHSNHVIEHLTPPEINYQFQAYIRILQPGGIVTIRCPNALGAAYAFWFDPILEGTRQEYVDVGFPKDESLSDPKDVWVHKDVFAVLHWFYGARGNPFNQHNSLITPTFLLNILTNNHFELLKVSQPESLNLVVIARKPYSNASLQKA
jgi:SAM-dependent methyltransferase